MISLSHWGLFDEPIYHVGEYRADYSRLTESFDGEFIPDRECGLSAQGAASERQLRRGSQRGGRDATWQKLNFGRYLP